MAHMIPEDKNTQSSDPSPHILVPTRQAEDELTAEYISAHAEIPAQPPTGGDFYAAFPMPEHTGDIGVIMGDVAGHGPEQAAQAEHMREMLSDCIIDGLSPADTLTAVNALIEPDPHFEGFGTVFVGTLKAETGELIYASGGHEPALIAAPDTLQEVEELVGTGPPVGAFPPEIARFEQHQTVLPAGGTLLLYTDGVSDARPPESRLEWLGIDRMKNYLMRLARLSPLHLVSSLLNRVVQFCGGYFHDDVALMAIRRRPQPYSRKRTKGKHERTSDSGQ